MEQWKEIPGTNGFYSASNEGRIRSEPIETGGPGPTRGNILKQYLKRKGYHGVSILVPGRKKADGMVHRLVYLAFNGPIPAGMTVNHKDTNKSNNTPDNLELMTNAENVKHGFANGCYGKRLGTKNNMAKLTEDAARDIKTSYPAISVRDLCKKYGVTKHAIYNVINGKCWQHV